MKSVFTTGQVGKICKVAPRTVSKWFDSGRLQGYRIPGSQDRRIPREYLIKFLREHGMPLGDLLDESTAKVLLVTQDGALRKRILDFLTPERCFAVEVVENSVEAGHKIGTWQPDCIVVDMHIGEDATVQICSFARNVGPETQVDIVAILPNGSTENDANADETFQRSFKAEQLATWIRQHVSQRKELRAA